MMETHNCWTGRKKCVHTLAGRVVGGQAVTKFTASLQLGKSLRESKIIVFSVFVVSYDMIVLHQRVYPKARKMVHVVKMQLAL